MHAFKSIRNIDLLFVSHKLSSALRVYARFPRAHELPHFFRLISAINALISIHYDSCKIEISGLGNIDARHDLHVAICRVRRDLVMSAGGAADIIQKNIELGETKHNEQSLASLRLVSARQRSAVVHAHQKDKTGEDEMLVAWEQQVATVLAKRDDPLLREALTENKERMERWMRDWQMAIEGI